VIHPQDRDVKKESERSQSLSGIQPLEKIPSRDGSCAALSARVEAVREEESARIARKLHDQLGSVVATTSQRVDAALETVRRISPELRPSILDDLGLAAAIEWQAQQFEVATGVISRVVAHVDGLSEPDGEQATAIFRILQEALTNTRRHATGRVGLTSGWSKGTAPSSWRSAMMASASGAR
jgi:signal transduction histidine kinase